jgi:uncharacterized protein (TIGR03118 family)
MSLSRGGRVTALLASVGAALALAAVADAAPANRYVVTPLVTDTGVGNTVMDPNLVNAWGLTASSSSPWWVADNGMNVSTLYTGAGAIIPLVVSVGDAPTGVVFNNTTGFALKSGTASRFIFDTESGIVSAWAGGPSAEQEIPPTGASYKGLAIAQTTAGPRLYAANFHDKRVDVFDGDWKPVHAPFQFFDPTIPSSYGPFGIQTIGSRVYVAYAKKEEDEDEEVRGQGLGFVDSFDTATGIIRSKVAIHGQLDAPWGLALAPDKFGRFSGDLLVGNFGNGRINAFRPVLGQFIWVPDGQLRDASGDPVFIDGLWALEFGNGAAAGPTDSLFFTAGPDEESHGLFGQIRAAP